MSDFITLDKMWLMPVIIGAVVLIALIVKEVLRSDRRALWLRILFSVFAILSLLLILLKPSIKESSKGAPNVILTSGYHQNHLDSIKKALNPNKVVHYDSMSYAEKKSWFNQNASLVIGDGIPAYDIPLWQNHNIKYHGGPHPIDGFQSLNFTKEHHVGDDFVVKGDYQVGDDTAKVVLKAYGQAIDSVLLNNGQFTLRAPLKTTGKFLFKLEEHVGNQLYTHTVPVVVHKARLNNILMLNAFPTFELKYLKNFLAEEGHKLTVRNRLTKGRYKFESYNTRSASIYRLNKQLLANYDLIIVDQQTIQQLTTAENNALTHVVKSGTGLLLLPGENTFNKSSDLHSFNFKPISNSSLPLNLPDQVYSVDSYGFQIEKNVLVTTLLDDMAATYRLEAGKIGTTTLKNTYQLVLSGDDEAYRNLWTTIIKPLVFREDAVLVKSNWPNYKDEPIALNLQGPDSITNLEIAQTRLAPRQDVHIPSHWYATYWPDTTGWHEVVINSDTSWLYINASGEFKSLKRIQNRNANIRTFSQVRTNAQSETAYWAQINLVWFYLLFLISVGYLWLEPKLS